MSFGNAQSAVIIMEKEEKMPEYTTSHGEKIVYNRRTFRHQIKNHQPRNFWLILTKDETCKRGEYAEEFDVTADGEAQAKRIAQAIMDKDYIDGLRISRVEWQGRAH